MVEEKAEEKQVPQEVDIRTFRLGELWCAWGVFNGERASGFGATQMDAIKDVFRTALGVEHFRLSPQMAWNPHLVELGGMGEDDSDGPVTRPN